MYKLLSNCEDKKAVIENGWAGAIADAKQRYQDAAPEEKQRWMVVMGVIQNAIERGEPWPA